MTYKEQYQSYLDAIENYLKREVYKILPCGENGLAEAMTYSLSAGGKRIRPVLMLAFCDILGVNIEKALPFAAALECVHTSSLIHDDMPCLDNDDMRRGKPSCHKVYGEGLAMLAGDALMNFAYELALKGVNSPDDIAALSYFAKCAGFSGMLGGQAYDLFWENSLPNEEKLLKTDMLKTAMLIKAPVVMAGLLGGKSDKKLELFGEKLGLMFQFSDDLIDETGDSGAAGKTVGKDKQAGKLTAVAVYGIDNTAVKIDGLKDSCLAILEEYRGTQFMRQFVQNLAKRKI